MYLHAGRWPLPNLGDYTFRSWAISTLQVIAADADQEIVEIFIEEAGEVMVELSRTIPAWCNKPDDTDLLSGIRRGFHTVKGSGRMVGAMATGEFAWAFENLLNKVIEHYVPATDQVLALVNQSVPCGSW
jgi:chemosensory pili system protein ChpA (sensor histidine kinase/response regulator)